MDALAPLMPDVDFAYDEVTNLHELIEELRPNGPVVRVKYLGAPVWAILDHKELNQAFNDLEHFDPGDGYRIISAPSMGMTMQTMSGEKHRVARASVAAPFLPASVRGYVERLIEPIAHELMDRLEGQREVEFVQGFTRPYPFTVITRLLGIPVSDEAMLLEWAVKLIDFPWDPEGALKSKAAFDDYMTRIIEDRRRAPTDDFVSTLVKSEFEGRRLDNEQILSLFRLLFPAGSDTTYKNAGSLFACVLSDPNLRAMALKGNKEREALATEGLRWQPPTAMLPRMATGDIKLGDAHIKKGDWVLFGITAANRDPKVFPDAARFEPSRDNRELISFGRGVHFCLGMHLARRELETALRIVFERYPNIRIKPESEVEFVGGVLRGPRELWVQPYGAA
ncbi:MAG TPA: cytochrome P450 [Alphaproteobacteria bacterium]|nr:cytochrome P450 [Alphaproteobacteria bacterium]